MHTYKVLWKRIKETFWFDSCQLQPPQNVYLWGKTIKTECKYRDHPNELVAFKHFQKIINYKHHIHSMKTNTMEAFPFNYFNH